MLARLVSPNTFSMSVSLILFALLKTEARRYASSSGKFMPSSFSRLLNINEAAISSGPSPCFFLSTGFPPLTLSTEIYV